MKYTVGVDFGSLSGRAVVAEVETGKILASEVVPYRHGILTESLPCGKPIAPDGALQLPQDYTEVLFAAVHAAVEKAGVAKEAIIGLGLDATACSPLPVLKDGTPLCTTERFADEPNAYIKLWKHHSAQKYVSRIEAVLAEDAPERLAACGGYISSEHFLPKVTETAEEAPELYKACEMFMEVGDWLILQMTGRATRGYCAAAYKTYYDAVSGDVPRETLKKINPLLADLNDKYPKQVVMQGDAAGVLTAEAAEKLGLPAGTPVSAADVDAHATAYGCGVCQRGDALLVVGTSTCVFALDSNYWPVKGLNGTVYGGIMPGLYAYEGGQSGVGDMFAWLADKMLPESYARAAAEKGMPVQQYLSQLAEGIKPGQSGLVALDWFNGVRSTLMDFALTGVVAGLTCETKPEELYRCFLEATAFGARRIIADMRQAGLRLDKLYIAGGIPLKNPLMMQIYADVFNEEIYVIDASNTGALGSAVLGCAAGSGAGFEGLPELTRRMGKHNTIVYRPEEKNAAVYEKLAAVYDKLYFMLGKETEIMHELKAIAAEAAK